MKFRLFFLLAILFSWSCANSPSIGPSEEVEFFHITAPSHLYFKNIRSSFYLQTVADNRGIDAYRLRKIKLENQTPAVFAEIIINWLNDQAFLSIRANGIESAPQDTLQIYWTDGIKKGVLKMQPKPSYMDQYTFALSLKEKMDNNYKLSLKNGSDEHHPVFKNHMERVWFMTTLRDFQKLIEEE